MNIVLVIFDSLRKDCIGCYNSGRPGAPQWGWKVKTPHLDALAEESLVMTRAYPESCCTTLQPKPLFRPMSPMRTMLRPEGYFRPPWTMQPVNFRNS
ncbi:MAG: sulfatase-like hydrolase/transferase [Planctomycetota bacterium]|nr:sulfatase-like hydrolase/transferase [Planctomycetota bacterium]